MGWLPLWLELVVEVGFHINLHVHCTYVFQFVLVGHFVWRCQWRRISLSRFKSHVPGDKAFKSKVCTCERERGGMEGRERERGERETKGGGK